MRRAGGGRETPAMTCSLDPAAAVAAAAAGGGGIGVGGVVGGWGCC